ncbi:hypothetical protein ACTFIW_006221 [Dictyostelium discoideum]
MGNIIDKSKDNHEPVNQDAFVFWRSLKKIYEDPDSLNTRFSEFMDGFQNGDFNNESSNSKSGKRESKNESYVLMGETSKGDVKKPVNSSKISFVFSESQEAEAINRNLLQTINCKLQLIPIELNHFTLNLDNHYISERMFLSICATFLENNKNYHNRHMSTTLKETPLNTVKKKKIQSELQDYISKYYFTITKLSLKKILLSTRSLEGLSQVLRTNRSIVELDLGGNDLSCNGGIPILIAGLRENKTITRLNLSDIHAYDEGAFMISAYLLCSKSVKIIDLSTNHISDRGFESLLAAVTRNTLITSLFLSDNNIESSKIHSLNHLLKRNTAIQSIFDQIFDSIPWNRKFKTKVASFKRNVLKTRANSTLNVEQIEDDKTPLFRLMNKQGSSSALTASPEESDGSRFKVGKSEMTGKRPTMEDRMVAYGNFRNNPNSELYCIFDGHGGRAASDFAADNIYKIFAEFLDANNTPEESFTKAYKSINTQISPWPFIGTTAASVYICENKVYIANVGDSRVVLGKIIGSDSSGSSGGGGGGGGSAEGGGDEQQPQPQQQKKTTAERLTFDHRPVEESERLRITEAGGTVLNGRVNGMLAVSRALGDSFLTPYVIPDPHLSSFTISKDDKFLILACDGVWDLISDEEAVETIAGISDPNKAAETLRDLAYNSGSTDNISFILATESNNNSNNGGIDTTQNNLDNSKNENIDSNNNNNNNYNKSENSKLNDNNSNNNNNDNNNNNSEIKSNLVYPTNLTRTYEGNWNILQGTISKLNEFEKNSGVIIFNLRNFKIDRESIQDTKYLNESQQYDLIEGSIRLKDGNYRGDSGIEGFLYGIYEFNTGLASILLLPYDSNQVIFKRPTNPINITMLINQTQSEQIHSIKYQINTIVENNNPYLFLYGNNGSIIFNKNNITNLHSSNANSDNEIDGDDIFGYGDQDDIKFYSGDNNFIMMKLIQQFEMITKEQNEKVISDLLVNNYVNEDESKFFIANGVLESTYLNLTLSVKVSGFDLPLFRSKMMNYVVMISLCSFIQIFVLIRQMDYTGTQTSAARVSIYTIGIQTIMDAYLCLIHLSAGVIMDYLFNAFATASFFQFVTFALFEMRYLLIILKARSPSAFADGWESLRRQISIFYLRFYSCLFGGFVLLYYFSNFFHFFLFLLFSYWVPQIYTNAKTSVRKPFLWKYVIGISITRLTIPLYFYACPKNIFVQPNPFFANILIFWNITQILILYLQSKLGPQFFIPARFLPTKYNFYRPISMEIRSREEGQGCVICMSDVEEGQKYMLTECNHLFHEKCLLQWLEFKAQCPTCRSEIVNYIE